AVSDHLVNQHPYHLDVEAALGEELTAAYAFLSAPQAQHLWRFCAPELVHFIRTRNAVQITLMREDFLDAVRSLHQDDLYRLLPRTPSTNPTFRPEDAVRTVPVALAWAVIVESALLNERLVEDMLDSAGKGRLCVPDGGLPFFLPQPPPEARKLFNEYVA